MSEQRQLVTILVADDDPDDRMLMRDALAENRLAGYPQSGCCVHFVEDGEELMEYLHRRGRYADPQASPLPSLILLDLNMPRKDGREVLKEIDADPDLRRIPVVVLTTSEAEEDIERSYGLGAHSFVTKPVTFSALVELTRNLGRITRSAGTRLDIVALPVISHETC